MGSILDETTANFMSKWNQLPSHRRLKKIENVTGRENDILFLIKCQRYAFDEWEIFQIVSDDEQKVINFMDNSYDEWEIIIKMTINKVYRIR